MNENVYKNMKDLGEDNWWFLIQGKIVEMFLERHLKEKNGQAILDVGSGTGRLFKTLSMYGLVWGIETHKDSAELCREMGYSDVWTGKIENAAYPDEMFDIITCVDVLEHVEKDIEGLYQCYRMLKKGGHMFLTVPAGQLFFSRNEQQYGHYRRYDLLPLKEKIATAGLQVLETGYFNLFLLPPIVLVRKLIDILLKAGILNKPVEEIKLPFLIDRLFKLVFNIELLLLKKHRFPYGLSLLVVLKK